MEENKNSVGKSALVSGTLLGVVLVIYSLIMYFLDQTGNKYVSWLSVILMIAGIVYLQIQYRDKELKGNMSYGKAFGFAVLMVLVASVITSIFTYLLFSVIDPGLIDKILAMSEEQLTKRGMNADQIELAMKMSRKMMSPPIMAVFGLIGNMFWGTIISLITSAITKKEPSPFAEK